MGYHKRNKYRIFCAISINEPCENRYHESGTVCKMKTFIREFVNICVMLVDSINGRYIVHINFSTPFFIEDFQVIFQVLQ